MIHDSNTRAATSIAFLPDRLNEAPVVFRGLTSVELAMVAGAAIAVWLPIALLVCGLFGFLMMGFGVAAGLALATVWCLAGQFERLKRGKPPGYHRLRVMLWLQDRGWRSSHYIRRSGYWSTERSR